jgi:chemotaxis protein CheD
VDSDKLIHITQGECRISSDPQVSLSTILGSCVAACIWDPRAAVGGMNHFLLPFGPSTGQGGSSLRYGAQSMEILINGLLKLGATKRNLQAKLFGGATMSTNLGRIGIENATFAREFLINESIPCCAEDLGGNHARRVVFFPLTGQARVMRVQNADLGVEIGSFVPKPEIRKNNVVLF